MEEIMKYQKLLKKILFVLCFGPLVPIIGIPDNGSNDGNGNNDANNDSGNNAGNGNNDSNGNGENNSSSNNGQVVFGSQAEFDKIIQSRIKTAVSKAVEENESKHKKAQMTVEERLQAEKTEAENKANLAIETANERLIKAEVTSKCSSLNIIDPTAAFSLMSREGVSVSDNGEVIGVEAALKTLAKEKAYLVGNNQNTDPKPGGDDQNTNPDKNKSNFNMNALIRKAVNRE
jgi:hypothetical protein